MLIGLMDTASHQSCRKQDRDGADQGRHRAATRAKLSRQDSHLAAGPNKITLHCRCSSITRPRSEARPHTDSSGCNANSASAAINKWVKQHVADGFLVHSFLHSFRNRLRRVECPSDIADAIGGWATAGAGQKYGSRYGL